MSHLKEKCVCSPFLSFFVAVNFSSKIILWYREHRRELPWRETNNPYHIWLSEIILQQTRVNQGMAYYYKFIEHFPTVHDLARAEEEQVLRLWQGLGYYNRARNLHFTAKDISEKKAGIFPNTFDELKKLKGVGDYTAAAIASFSYKENVPVVDGNVYRVLSRYFAEETPINTGKGQKLFFSLAQELIPKDRPDDFNQAIMEFGALQCTPKNPNCEECIFKNKCLAFVQNKVAQLPVKKGKTKVSNLFISFLVIQIDNKLVFQQRNSKSIWANLYEFPSIESTVPTAMEEVVNYVKKNYLSNTDFQIDGTKILKHKLSHRNIEAEFIEISRGELKTKTKEKIILVDPRNLSVGIHRLIENYLQQTDRL